MTARHSAIDAARHALATTDPYISGPNGIRLLRRAVAALLQVVDDQPPSVRLAAQRDEEFANLARAVRMEIHAARHALARLDSFETALTRLLWPENGGDQ